MKNLFERMRKLIIPLSAVLMLTLLFSACKKDNDDFNTDQQVAGLMSFNLAADKPAVGVSIGGSNLTNVPLNYTNYTGVYQSIYPGSRQVDAYDFTTGAAFARATQNFEVDKYYSSFILGNNGSYKNVIVEDMLDSISTTTGDAFVRYINAIQDSTITPMVSMTVGTDIMTKAVAYGDVSAFTGATPGDVTFKVSNGTTIDAERTFAVEKDKVYTVLLLGVPGESDPAKAVQIKYISNGTITQ